MRNLVARLLPEPLVQFLLLGAALFALYALVASDTGGRRDRIVVDGRQVSRLAMQFERTWMRPPTAAELDGLIEDHVKEEILYREALALGLDKDDLVVRRRLRQKMDFLNEDIAAQQQPSEADLQAYLDSNPEPFRIPARMTFQQVYLSPQKHGPDTPKKAAALLAQLNARGASAPSTESLGDATLLPDELDDATVHEIGRTFGAEFAAALAKSTGDRWSGPVESGYGMHIVRVTARAPARVPSLAEVRDVVEREWSAARRAEVRDAFYASLRQRYEVSIERPGAVAATEPAKKR